MSGVGEEGEEGGGAMEQLDDLTSGRLQGEIMSRIRVAIRGRSHWLIWLRHVSVSTSTLVF